MLEEYLNHQKVSNDLYVSQVKGLTAYSFKKQQDSFYCLSPDVHKNSLEIFFCLGGKLKLENQTHDLYSIVSGEIALLSGIGPMLYCRTEGMLEGILICMDISYMLENFTELYGDIDAVYERHRHRYEFNNKYKTILEKEGLICSGVSPDGKLVEIIEYDKNDFFIACQFHPEFKSRPNRPAPLFKAFVKATKEYKKNKK